MDDGAPDLSCRTVALTGFMGSGKSSVGRRLALQLGRDFHDADAAVVSRCGRSISEMFAAGEVERFRDEEAIAVRELVNLRPPTVVALGGGALEREATLELVRSTCVLVHLAISWEDVSLALPRLLRGRPMLAGRTEEEIHRLYDERQSAYDEAHVRVALTYGDIGNATRAVFDALGRLSASGAEGP